MGCIAKGYKSEKKDLFSHKQVSSEFIKKLLSLERYPHESFANLEVFCPCIEY